MSHIPEPSLTDQLDISTIVKSSHFVSKILSVVNSQCGKLQDSAGLGFVSVADLGKASFLFFYKNSLIRLVSNGLEDFHYLQLF